MIFLNGVLLAALAAAGIPLLIHLLNPRRRRPLLLATTRFLKAIEGTHLRRLRITRLLLLLLRTAIIVLLVLSFARPAHQGLRLAGKRQGLHAVILLDNSLSTGRNQGNSPGFDQIKSRCRELLEAATPEDRFTLVTLAAPAAILGAPQQSAASLKDELSAIQHSESADDLWSGLAIARQLLEQPDLTQEIHLFSDDALYVPEDSLQLTWPAELGAWLHSLPVSDTREPGFSAPVTEQGLMRRTEVLHWTLPLRNWPRSVDTEIVPTLQLTVAGEVVYSRKLRPEDRRVELHFPRPAPGEWPLELKLQGVRDLPIWREVLRVPRALNIQLLTSDSPMMSALHAALVPDSSYTGIRLQDTSLKSFGTLQLSDWDAVVLPGPDQLARSTYPALKKAIEAGLGVLLMPTQNPDPQAMTALFKELGLPAVSGVSQTGHWKIGLLDQQHPIFSGMFKPGHNPGGPEFRRVLELAEQENSGRTLLSLGSGAPLLKSWKLGQGRLLFLGSVPVESWSDLAYSGLFAPLMQASVRWLALGKTQGQPSLLCGKGYRLTFQPQEGEVPQLLGPNGSRLLPPPSRAGQLQIPALNHSAFYELSGAVQGMQLLAVNADIGDLEHTFAGLPALESGTGLNWQQSEGKLDRLLETRRGQELWRVFLLAALCLLLIEQLLAMRNTAEKKG